jgi:hypothetical protein
MADDYKINVTFMVSTTVKINPVVFSHVDDEWRSMFYNLVTPSEVIEHIAYNLLQGFKLSQMDGFANFPDEYDVLIGSVDYELDSVEEEE